MNVKIINVKKVEWHIATKPFKNNCHSFRLKKALACIYPNYKRMNVPQAKWSYSMKPYTTNVYELYSIQHVPSKLRMHSIQHICPHHRMLFPSLPPLPPPPVLFLPSHSFNPVLLPENLRAHLQLSV
jgi:hypothetical protein